MEQINCLFMINQGYLICLLYAQFSLEESPGSYFSDQILTDTECLKIENAASIQLSTQAHCEYQKAPRAVFKEIHLLQL